MHGSFPRAFLFMLAGPLIWAVHYLTVYSVHGIACARPAWHATWAGVPASQWLIVAASAVALLAMALIHVRFRRRMPPLADARFLPWLAGALSLLSAVAVVWETIPVLWLPACG
jgi:hypothetical protein